MVQNLARKIPLLMQNNFELDYAKYCGVELKNKTAGIIGKAISEKAKGLGMNLVYWSKNSKTDLGSYIELDELFKTSGFIFPTMSALTVQYYTVMTDQTGKLHQLLTFSSKTVFTTRDLSNIWGYNNYDSLIERIEYFTKTKKLQKIQKGMYAIVGRDIDEFELANKLRSPSYISFETVLHKDGIIFQWNKRITLASNKSIQLALSKYVIIFRQLKDPILLNKNSVENVDNYYIATKERAFLDMLYINPKFQFDNLRGIDFDKVHSLLGIYNRKSLSNIVEKLEKHVGSY
ncbi:hypothetical protein CO058_00830 [candidate division WWE3 bacterium CG_4_9_14_0_2_um_filter_35_11]|uniref:D-isomer specific 2-hydroxyacid dehydrogenase NAD-binding domain-containing protein n=1 Tax=candidate division WWE3 bacterium CG_4_9_14_0_2_um_filter_35_11 TaxID=1975077 RepID=A0A2M8EMJ5_UNCKA|nr:MAG: hypothetical protein COV25_03860 [candidate division WWE3 bacterium CG10_big_fil_rev_8_21_14_0_10_35_32]PJC23941.1 MAG: hypothetical protein CO058_00830 [candidate division WWE3 bacterium CG_4_9_14_0_2_um_filter_35_11]